MYSQSGNNTTNSYLFAGQMYDASTELYQMRARYYDPSIGRFTSRDEADYNLQNPIELNRYGYTANNPTNWTDPSGYALLETNLRYFSVSFNIPTLTIHGITVANALRIVLVALIIIPQLIAAFGLANGSGSSASKDVILGPPSLRTQEAALTRTNVRAATNEEATTTSLELTQTVTDELVAPMGDGGDDGGDDDDDDSTENNGNGGPKPLKWIVDFIRDKLNFNNPDALPNGWIRKGPSAVDPITQNSLHPHLNPSDAREQPHWDLKIRSTQTQFRIFHDGSWQMSQQNRKNVDDPITYPYSSLD